MDIYEKLITKDSKKELVNLWNSELDIKKGFSIFAQAKWLGFQSHNTF